jgi:RNA polymerase sigma-70 factor (ECF subfamily)
MIASRAKHPVSAQLATDATAELVDRARRGEAEATTTLVRAYLRPAYSVALAIVGRPADAEDVAQEALVTAFERIHTCREPSRFAGWLLQIVRNRARNLLDWRRLHDVHPEPDHVPEPSVEARVEQVGMRKRLLDALAQLPPVQRETVLLHDLEGWTHAEIAAALKMSEVMSRQHLFQARQVLRTKLVDDDPSEVNP